MHHAGRLQATTTTNLPPVLSPDRIPPTELPELRKQYELLLEKAVENWEAEESGKYERQAQPRMVLSDSPLADQIDQDTAGALAVWLSPRTHGVSSRLLGVADASVTSMLCMCNPVVDHSNQRDWRGWHRDFYPPHCSSLKGYQDDIIENGPRYVQWNLPLYDDDVLQVVRGSHVRSLSTIENSIIDQDDHSPLPDGMVVNLKAGDGVAYILPLLHWGSCYSTKMRRTLHGGYSVYSELPGMQPASAGHLFAKAQGRGYLAALTETQRAPFRRWAGRSEEACDIAELMLRGASSSKSDGGVQLAKAVDMWHSVGGHALRGWAGVMQTLIMLAKAARRVYYLSALGQDSEAFVREVSEQEANWVRSLV